MRPVDVARILSSCTAGAAMVVGSTAWGAEPCASVVAPEHLAPAWATQVEQLRSQLAVLPASECEPTTLTLELVDGEMRVVATRGEGRRAERRVTRPETLVSTALGLVMTIPSGAPPVSAPVRGPDAIVPVLPPPPAPTAPRAPVPLAPPTIRADWAPHLWTGASAGVRLAAPTGVTVLDVEARADLVTEHWLMMVTIRSALVSCLGGQGVDCDVYNDVSLGIGVGRRIPAGAAELDVAFEPSFVVMHMEYDTASEAESFDSTMVTLRLDTSARLAVPLGKTWALTLTVDAGLAPSLLASPTQLAVPAGEANAGAPPFFPAWTGGVRVGAMGALL